MEKKRKEKGAESVAFGGVGIIVLRHGRRRRRPNLSSASSETEGPNDPALGSSWLNGLRLQLDGGGGGGYSQCTAKVGAVVLRHGRRRRRIEVRSARPLA
jgi:hypothetical protein